MIALQKGDSDENNGHIWALLITMMGFLQWTHECLKWVLSELDFGCGYVSAEPFTTQYPFESFTTIRDKLFLSQSKIVRPDLCQDRLVIKSRE